MREEIISAAVERTGSVVLELLSRGDDPTADALRLLLRGYAATGRDDFRNALEVGLARAIEIADDSSSETAAPWLMLIGEASDASDDERLRACASNLASKIKMIWGATRSISLSASSVDACLRAKLELPDAVDELERVIGRAYEPGEGIRGSLEDEMAVAGALLTAFVVTGRLP